MPTDLGMAGTRPDPKLAANVVSEAMKLIQPNDGYLAPFNAAARFNEEIKPVNEEALMAAILNVMMRDKNSAVRQEDDYIRGMQSMQGVKVRDSDRFKQGEHVAPFPIAGSMFGLEPQMSSGGYAEYPMTMADIFTAFGR